MRAAAMTLIASAAFAGAACGTDDTTDRRPEQPPAERRDEGSGRQADAQGGPGRAGARQRHRKEPARSAPSGRRIFVERCGGCHTLADAGTTGTVGPNLDEHFSSHHMPDVGAIRDTIRRGPGRMPANRVEGRDARAVAKYVVRATRH